MKPRQILVFPAGTEIGLEIFEALKHCKEVELHAAGQDVPNHAMYAYPRYHTVPSIREPGWVERLASLCRSLSIDYIFPAYDDVIVALAEHAHEVPAAVVSSPLQTCLLTRSKRQTYLLLQRAIRVPRVYGGAEDVSSYPVLVKPDRGQGSQGVRRIDSAGDLRAAMAAIDDPLICEYLPGEEYTVDCFSDRERGLLFCGARARQRTRNGISVTTTTVTLPECEVIARRIGERLSLFGAWFFQLKRAADGELALLEVAPRIAGSMSAHRVTGVNFPLLSIFEHERRPISVLTNPIPVRLDRALRNRYAHALDFSTLYIDYDDTLIVHDRVNLDAVALVYRCIDEGIDVVLVTRHAGDIHAELVRRRLAGLFDRVIHLTGDEPKSAHIEAHDAIFVDDSFRERLDVHQQHGIPTFDASMIELLLHAQPSGSASAEGL